MLKKVFEKIKKAKDAEEYNRLNAQMMDLLSDVETIEQLKEVCTKEGMELSDEHAERMFEKLQHMRENKKSVLDMDELSLVSGGAPDWMMYPAVGPDEWIKHPSEGGFGVYRYNNRLYKRGNIFYVRALDGCASTEDGWCWVNDSCNAQWNIYDELYDGDERTDIDPANMTAAFINGEITGGEDF